MLIDFYDVKSIIDEWDHQHLNDVVDFVPTAELLAAEMRSRIIAAISRDGESIDVIQCRVRLWETPSCYAEVGDIG